MSATSSIGSPKPARIRLQEPLNPGEMSQGTPILVAAFPDGAAFLEHLAPGRGPAGELAIATRATPPPGLELVVEISWPALPNHVFLRARALRRWFGGQLVVRLEPDELPKRDFLVRLASGSPGRVYERKHRRYCVRLPLGWRRFGELALTDGVAEDLSAGGVLIATSSALPPVGNKVAVRLHAYDSAPELILTGLVMHSHNRLDGHAFGVQFQYRESGEQRTLRTVLRAFGARGVVLVDPTA